MLSSVVSGNSGVVTIKHQFQLRIESYEHRLRQCHHERLHVEGNPKWEDNVMVVGVNSSFKHYIQSDLQPQDQSFKGPSFPLF